MSAWSSPIYKLWVVGGLIGIVAFAVIGGMSDPSNQDFVLYLIPVIAVWVGGIFALQWRANRRDERSSSPAVRFGAELNSWSIRLGGLLCLAIFAGVFAYYAGLRGTLYPLGEDGPGLPYVLVPAVALVVFAAGRTMNLLRSAQRESSD
jgi:hypothetical protein